MAKRTPTGRAKPLQVSGIPEDVQIRLRERFQDPTDWRRYVLAVTSLIYDPDLNDGERSRLDVALSQWARVMEQSDTDDGRVDGRGIVAVILHALGGECVKRLME